MVSIMMIGALAMTISGRRHRKSIFVINLPFLEW